MRFKFGDFELLGFKPSFFGLAVEGGLFVEDYDYSGTEVESIGDVSRLGVDGVHAGRDFARSSQWVIRVGVRVNPAASLPPDFRGRGDQVADAILSAANALIRAWNAPAHRSGPMVPLSYSTASSGSDWLFVRGRPRAVTPPKLDQVLRAGYATFTLVFDQLDPWHYGREKALTLTPGRSGSVTLAGDAASPAVVTFTGQLNNPRVSGAVIAGYKSEIKAGDGIVIDGRDMRAYQTRSGAVYQPSIAGDLSAETRLTKLVLRPGSNHLSLTGTGAGSARISTYDAYSMLGGL